MTHTQVASAPATSDAQVEELWLLDRDVAELFADVDEILCAALKPRRRPPAPPATGCALPRPRSAGGSWGGWVRPRGGPVLRSRATQRGPPRPRPIE
jgi:hypothetical protein